MCFVMMKEKRVKKLKRTPQQKEEAMKALTEMLIKSDAGQSIVRLMQCAIKN
jgi:hypothetical protein